VLTPKQLRCIELLTSGVKHTDIARELNIHHRTIKRWLKLDEFTEALEGVSYRPVPVSSVEVVNSHQARRDRLERLLDKALDTLEDCLDNPDAKPSDKIRSAQIIGDWHGIAKLPDYEGAIMVLQELGWIPNKVLEAGREGAFEFQEKIKQAFIDGRR
jgi:hypothetical protein